MGLYGVRLNPIGVAVLMISATGIFLFLYSSHLGYNHNAHHRDKISLQGLLVASIDAAIRGGKEAKAVRESADLKEKSKGKTKEGANDPLTEGDLRSHRIMLYTLKKTFPKLKVISEEHDETEPDFGSRSSINTQFDFLNNFMEDVEVPIRDVTVWVDPLDATQEYTENLRQYVTTMVCIAVHGKPVIGVIYKPFEDKLSWAWLGHSMSDDLKISPHKDKANESPTVIVSRSHAGKVKDVISKAFDPNSKVVPAGGAGYKTLEVIRGNADAYIHITLIKKWDICAGNVLLMAAGGRMTTLEGQDIKYDEQDGVRNDKGLVATLQNHEDYLKALQGLKD